MPIDEMVAKEAGVTIDGAVQAINRSRFVFLTITVSGILLGAATFNGYIPWVRNTSLRARWAALEAASQVDNRLLTSAEREEARVLARLKEDLAKQLQELTWGELQLFSVPILGIKIYQTDITAFGPVALFVLSVWWYFSLRRENRAIQAVVRLSKVYPAMSGWLHHGVAHHNVFTTTSGDAQEGPFWWIARWARAVLDCIPVWVSGLAVAADLLSLVVPRKIAIDTSSALAERIGRWEMAEIAGRFLIACVSIVLCLLLVRGCRILDRQTTDNLRALRELAESTATRRAATAVGG